MCVIPHKPAGDIFYLYYVVSPFEARQLMARYLPLCAVYLELL